MTRSQRKPKSATALQRKKAMRLVYCGPIEEATWEELYSKSFALLSPREKQEVSWQMVVDAWKIIGKTESELRLDRTTAVLKRI